MLGARCSRSSTRTQVLRARSLTAVLWAILCAAEPFLGCSSLCACANCVWSSTHNPFEQIPNNHDGCSQQPQQNGCICVAVCGARGANCWCLVCFGRFDSFDFHRLRCFELGRFGRLGWLALGGTPQCFGFAMCVATGVGVCGSAGLLASTVGSPSGASLAQLVGVRRGQSLAAGVLCASGSGCCTCACAGSFVCHVSISIMCSAK